ncbi:hypothetical protein VOLCADRAFT_121454 [Volvox carteri f. nagariensis]|uniref:Uncharacterized protein n=1 Tax=Volvox carteri f. nagariensis TaxID=3068 RepID=D8UAP6_VOLCA|nr:uncharacterized protein VOLCADRAFT_121454 [Volvox carteri f. nagariensis]EFJ43190.1 hypothetical protein VOLCADRAFT_121454 [Volvox carteri f. nagariensis]|eukprot:XP_002955765.1 hypothetical protein VOLCADRAFT_121454 [Volvox carteri f. nagariensis]
MQVSHYNLATRLQRCAPSLTRAHAPLPGIAARSGTYRRFPLIIQAAKGFGKSKPTPANTGANDEGPSKGRKGKAKRVQLQPGNVSPIPNQQRQQQSQDQMQAQFQTKLIDPDQSSEEEEEFMARLQALKAQGKEYAAAVTAADSAVTATAVTPAIFDAPVTPAGGGDYAPSSRRYSGIRPAQSPPDAIEEKILKTKITLYEDQLKADPNNDNITEALATSYARMLQYDRAAELLEKLSKRTPNDAEVWRLLGESSLLSQQPRKAVTALERAVELRRQQQQQQGTTATAVVTQPDLQLLTGLVDAYIANNDYPKAVDALRGVREDLQAAAAAAARSASMAAPAAALAVAPEAVGVEPRPAELPDVAEVAAEASVAPAMPEMLTAPPAPELAAAPAADTATSALPAAAPVKPLDPVGVELLTAKVYSAWRGHDQDALATYDELIKAFPEDYRGYLAKGVFLKEKGRKADAERMFLQARFFAPASKQQLVRAIAETKPAAPQLPDNN